MEDSKNQQFTPEELAQKKSEMLKFYKDNVEYLEAQVKYERLLAEIDEVRVRRLKAQHEFAYLTMTPEQEAEMRKQLEEVEAAQEENKPKDRKLKTK